MLAGETAMLAKSSRANCTDRHGQTVSLQY
ncbi:MAG: hypothetical protein JWR11_4840, partial [Mycobacterium sp.]|nr:hypothetical protein [Mycobacterium sp.]